MSFATQLTPAPCCANGSDAITSCPCNERALLQTTNPELQEGTNGTSSIGFRRLFPVILHNQPNRAFLPTSSGAVVTQAGTYRITYTFSAVLRPTFAPLVAMCTLWTSNGFSNNVSALVPGVFSDNVVLDLPANAQIGVDMGRRHINILPGAVFNIEQIA